MDNSQIVFVVDDDEAIRDSLSLLLDSVGIQNKSFALAQEFLNFVTSDVSGCIISDIRMPDVSGLDLQQTLLDRRISLPVIFITGHGDIPMAVDAMRNGALDFIRKPFREQELLDRINQAFTVERSKREHQLEAAAIQKKIAELTEREHEVFDRISSGEANKVVAIELGISERTVEVHRSNIMKKMEARSLAKLVRMRLLAEQN